MLGFVDRYDDYKNAAGDVIPVTHEGYKGDLMGDHTQQLNQSHYDAVVYFTNYMLARQLPGSKTNSTRLFGTVDGHQHSSVNPKDVPAGFHPVVRAKEK